MIVLIVIVLTAPGMDFRSLEAEMHIKCELHVSLKQFSLKYM